MKVWTCKIGWADGERLPAAADGPMREAVEWAFREITGTKPAFIFSGWGGQLTESELAVIEDRLPNPEAVPPMPDLTPEFLDALVAKAKAATPGPFIATMACRVVLPDDDRDALRVADTLVHTRMSHEQAFANAQFFAANSPDVTLALVTRIRELEDGHVNLGTQFVPEAVRMAEGWQELRVKLEARIRAADRLADIAESLPMHRSTEELMHACSEYRKSKGC